MFRLDLSSFRSTRRVRGAVSPIRFGRETPQYTAAYFHRNWWRSPIEQEFENLQFAVKSCVDQWDRASIRVTSIQGCAVLNESFGFSEDSIENRFCKRSAMPVRGSCSPKFPASASLEATWKIKSLLNRPSGFCTWRSESQDRANSGERSRHDSFCRE